MTPGFFFRLSNSEEYAAVDIDDRNKAQDYTWSLQTNPTRYVLASVPGQKRRARLHHRSWFDRITPGC